MGRTCSTREGMPEASSSLVSCEDNLKFYLTNSVPGSRQHI